MLHRKRAGYERMLVKRSYTQSELFPDLQKWELRSILLYTCNIGQFKILNIIRQLILSSNYILIWYFNCIVVSSNTYSLRHGQNLIDNNLNKQKNSMYNVVPRFKF